MPTETETTVTETTATETPVETFPCGGCGDDIEDGENCTHCVYCDFCEEAHNPDDTTFCAGCEERGRTVCEDSCERRSTTSCFYCENCNTRHSGRYTSHCETCNSCTDSHDCSYCESCGEYVDDQVCGDCDRCESCGCECRKTEIRLVSNPVRFFAGKPTVTFPWPRAVSCEIELAEGGDHAVDKVVDNWGMSVKEDGSVTDGCEINTSPASGDLFEKQIAELQASFRRTGVDTDHRCGIHVHVDTRDLTYRQRCRLALAYALLEGEFYSLVNRERRGNRYCCPRATEILNVFDWGTSKWESIGAWSTEKARTHFMTLATDQSVGRAPNRYEFGCPKVFAREKAKYDWAVAHGGKYLHPDIRKLKVTTKKRKGCNKQLGDRYHAFNVQSMFSHGTLEFRLPEGRPDADYAGRWGVLVAAFIEWVKKAKDDKIEALASMEASERFDLLMNMLPTEDQRNYWRNERSLNA